MTAHLRAPLANLSRAIFRAYDIRGDVPGELNTQLVYWLGRAIAQMVRKSNNAPICIGADGRISGPELKQALILGIREGGSDLIDLGYVPTPVIYFMAHQQPEANAVVLSASHNPPHQNGLKVMIAGHTLMDQEISNLADLAMSQELCSGAGKLIELDPSKRYLSAITKRFCGQTPRTLIVDSANGIAGPLAARLLQKLGHQVEPIFAEVDGRFPNHAPDPCTTEHLHSLINKVTEQPGALGVAFDGDGDRLVLIDERARPVAPDQLLILLALQEIADNQQDRTVIADIKCSSTLATVLTDAGAEVRFDRTGHAPMKHAMRAYSALIGGELSAHYYFRDWYSFDDGLYTLAKVLSLLDRQQQLLSELVDQLPKSCSTPEIRVPYSEASKLVDALSSKLWPEAKVTQLDGLRIQFADGWALIRASNTEAALVMRFEATDAPALAQIQTEISQKLIELSALLGLQPLDQLLRNTGEQHATLS